MEGRLNLNRFISQPVHPQVHGRDRDRVDEQFEVVRVGGNRPPNASGSRLANARLRRSRRGSPRGQFGKDVRRAVVAASRAWGGAEVSYSEPLRARGRCPGRWSWRPPSARTPRNSRIWTVWTIRTMGSQTLFVSVEVVGTHRSSRGAIQNRFGDSASRASLVDC